MRSSLEKRLERLEKPLKTVSIFGDWAKARNPDFNGTDEDAFSQWLDFQQTATPEEYEDPKLNPDVGDFSAGLGSNKF